MTKTVVTQFKDRGVFEIAHVVVGSNMERMTASAHFSGNTVRVWCFGFGGPRKDFRV
jgi:hypothetical protein